MSTHIYLVESTDQIAAVARLAKQIWQQHFTPIIGADQVAYMLKNFQSAEAIQKQIAEGALYFMAQIESEPAGYMGLIADSRRRQMMLSKLYVKDVFRGAGIGKALLNDAEAFAVEQGMTALWLTVNRFNDDTIRWYQHQEFSVVDEQKKDIGNGFFMDDFIMEKAL